MAGTGSLPGSICVPFMLGEQWGKGWVQWVSFCGFRGFELCFPVDAEILSWFLGFHGKTPPPASGRGPAQTTVPLRTGR